MKTNLHQWLGVVLTTFALTTAGNALAAVTKTWDSGGTTNVWNNAANWDLDVAPTNGDNLVFGSGTKLIITNNLLTSIGTLTFTNGNFTVSGNAVTITNGISNTTSNNIWAINTTFNTTQLVTVEAAANTLTLSGVLAGAGGINKAGSGTLILSGANTFNAGGNVVVDGGGELRLSSLGALGNSTGVTLNASTVGSTGTKGNKLGLNGVNSPATTTITMNSVLATDARSSIYTTAGSNNVNGPLILQGDGSCQITCNTAGQTLVVNGNITGAALTGLLFARGAAPLIFNSPNINLGAGRFDKTDANVVTINTSGHTWSATEILNGTVKLGVNNALPTTAAFVLGQTGANSPVLDLGGFNQTLTNLLVNALMTNPQGAIIGNSSLLADSTLSYQSVSNSTFTGTLMDSVSGGTRKLALTMAGGGSLTLTSTNSYSGPTLINDAGSKLVVNTLQTGGASFTANNGTTLGVTIPTAGTTLQTVALTLGSGTVVTNEYNLGSGNPTAPAIYATNLTANGTVYVNVTGLGLALGQFPLLKYGSASGVSGSTFVANILPAGVLAYASNNIANASIDLVVTAAPLIAWTGGTNDGVNLVLQSGWDINTTSNWVDSLTVLPTVYTDGQVVQFDDSAPGTNLVTLAASVAPGSVTVTNAARDYAITGASAIIGAGRFTKGGAGMVTVATANTYSGDTLINKGTFRLGAANVIPDGAGKGNVVLGGTLDLAGFAETINGLNGSGNITNSAATATTLTLGNNNQSGVFTGPIQNTGALSLTKVGAGGLTLSGNNSFSGNLTLSAGSLTLNGPATPTGNLSLNGTLHTLGNITNSGAVTLVGATTLNLDAGTTLQLGGNWTGAQTLTKIGGGNLVLTGAGTFGSFWPQNGAVWLQNNAVITNSAYVSIGRIGSDDVTCYLRNNAVWVVTNADFNVGDTVNAIGRLYVQDTAKLYLKNLWLGKNTTCQGYMYQSGGVVTNAFTASSDWRIAGDNGAASNTVSGYYLSGGRLDVRANFQIGAYGIGEMIVSGGQANIWAGTPAVGRFTNALGRLVISGGQFNHFVTTTTMNIGEGGTGSLVVSNTGVLFCSNTLNVGNFNTTPGTGTVALVTGGLITVPKVAKGNVAGYGTFNFDGGTLRAGTNNLTFMQGLDVARILNGGAILDSSGYDVTVGQPLLAGGTGGLTKIGLGSFRLEGASTYTGPTLVSNGRLMLSTLSTGGGTISVADTATLGVTVGKFGTSLNASSVTLGGGVGVGADFNFSSYGNPSVAPIHATNLVLNGTITVNVVAGNLTPGAVKLITFENPIAGAGGFVLGTLPPGVTASGIATNGNSIELTITAAQPLVWRGTVGNTNWDINTTANWDLNSVATKYQEPVIPGNSVRFDDSLILTGLTNVNLTNAVSPAAITVSNTLLNYFFSGTGKISGPAVINKAGTNFLRINTANDFTGPVNINEGTVIAGNAAAFGATNGSVNIASGATLDVNGLNLGAEPVTVAGNGWGGNGAIINSGASQQNALRYVTLTGDTLFAGTNRWDIRGSNTADPTTAGLSTGGNPSNLAISNLVTCALVGATVDPALANVDVQRGIFSFESASTGLGNPANTLTIWSNATLMMWNATNQLNKRIVLNGGTNAINNGSGANTIIGPITLNAASTLNVAGTSLTLSGPIGETVPALLTKAPGATLLVLGGTNTYTGGTAMTTGTLQLGNGGVGGDAGTGAITNDNGTLQFNRSDDFTFNNPVYGTNGVLVKVNTNTITLGATNYYLRTGASVVQINGGTMIVPANTAIISGGEFWVAQNAVTGACIINGGTITCTNWFVAGRNSTSAQGTVTLNSGTITKTGSGNVILGSIGGNGTLNVNGGNFYNNSWLAMGENAGAVALLNLNGGMVQCTALTRYNAQGLSSIANFNGGTLLANGNNANFITINNANVKAGGLVLDDGGYVITNTQPLIADVSSPGGGLTKQGAGTVYLNSVNTYTGPTVVANGTLAGSGIIAGSLTVGPGANLAPGNSIGTLTVNGSVTYQAGATAAMEINAANGTHDLVAGATQVNYGGTLALTVTAGTLTGGETFDLFDFSGTSSGTFATITTTPALAANLNWWQGSLAANGVIVLNRAPVAVPIPMGGLSGATTAVQIIGGKYAPTDADGDPLVVSAVQNPASAGGTVSTDGTSAIYTAPSNFTGIDTFNYIVSDGRGGLATNLVTVTVLANGGSYNQLSDLVVNGATSSISYLGIPGYKYALDVTTNLTPVISWTPVITNTAAANGQLNYTFDTVAPPAFFRTRYVP